MAFRLPPRAVLAIWISYWCVLFVLTHIPMAQGPIRFQHADKVEHVVAYFGLTMLGGWRLALRHRHVSRALLWRWAAAYALYGIADEALQPLVERTLSLGDWLADAAGIVVGTLAFEWILRKRLSEPSAR